MFTSNNYKEITSKLKFISKIRPGEKINTKPYLSIVNDDWFTALFRKFYNFESRTQTVQFISEIIASAFQIIEQIKITSKTQSLDIDATNVLLNLYRDLIASKDGITNLIETYKADKIVVCQLETIIENIDLFLQLNNVTTN